MEFSNLPCPPSSSQPAHCGQSLIWRIRTKLSVETWLSSSQQCISMITLVHKLRSRLDSYRHLLCCDCWIRMRAEVLRQMKRSCKWTSGGVNVWCCYNVCVVRSPRFPDFPFSQKNTPMYKEWMKKITWGQWACGLVTKDRTGYLMDKNTSYFISVFPGWVHTNCRLRCSTITQSNTMLATKLHCPRPRTRLNKAHRGSW